MDMGTIGAKWLKKEGMLTGLDESEEINACTVQVQGGRGRRGAGLAATCSRTRPTTIPPRSSPSAARPPAWAAPSATPSRAAPTCTRPCASQARPIPLVPVADTHSRQAALSASSSPPRRRATPPTATRSAWPRVRCTSCTTLATPPSAWRSARWWAPRRPTTCVARPRRRAMWWCCSAAARAATASAAPRALPRPIPLESLESCGAEVQKGNAPVERKIQRLFRRGDACRMIKRCNDFGAGGVSVAIGELADGLDIDLDAVPKKYDGLDGTELAISESPGAHGRSAGARGRGRLHRARPRGEPGGHAGGRGYGRAPGAHALARRHYRGREPRVPREQRSAEACGGGRTRAGRRELRRKCLRPRLRGDKRADRPRGGRRVRRRLAGSVPRGAHGRHQPRLEQGPRGALRLHHRRGHGAHAFRRRSPAHPGTRHGGEAAGARRQDHHGFRPVLGLQPVPFVLRSLRRRLHGCARFRGEASGYRFRAGEHVPHLPRVLREAAPGSGALGQAHGGGARRAHGPDRFRGGRHRRQGLHVRFLRGFGRAADARVLRDGYRQYRPHHLTGAEGGGRQPHLRFPSKTRWRRASARPSTR